MIINRVARSSDALAKGSQMSSDRNAKSTPMPLFNITDLSLHKLRRKVAESNDVDREATYDLVVELLTTALFTAVASSIITARAQGRSLRFLGPTSAYFPTQPEILDGLMATSPHPFFDQSLTAHLARAYSQLRFVATVTPKDAGILTAEGPVTTVDITQLMSAWQKLAGQFRMLLLTLFELDLIIWPDQTLRLYEIKDLSKSASDGGTPCVLANGVVFVPSWLDRRRETRISVGVSVWIESTRGRHRAVLKNFSSSGFGLSTSPSFEIGSFITVELPDKRHFTGTVIWCHGGNVGMRLDTFLGEKDPLFVKVATFRRMAKSSD